MNSFNSDVKKAGHAHLKALCAYNSVGVRAEPGRKRDQEIRKGLGNIVFLSPGHVTGKGRYRNLLKRDNKVYNGRVIAFIVDEAHCVFRWGPDFRPEYLLLNTCLALLGSNTVPCGAFTATATPEDQLKLIHALDIQDVKVLQAPSNRPNIFLEVKDFEYKDDEPAVFDPLIQELKQHGADTPKLLVYCKRKDDGKDYAEYISDKIGIDEESDLIVDSVCGDMPPDMINAITADFMSPNSRIRVLFASEVLGMGIDIKGLYRVWIMGQPDNLRDFSQLFGRCGRDGKDSTATLFVADNAQTFSCDKAMKAYCKADSCLRLQLMRYFWPHCPTVVQERCCVVCQPPMQE